MHFLEFEDASYTDIPENSGLEFESKLPVVNKVWKCPVCERKYNTKEALYDHTYKEHIDIIPEGMSASQYLFNIRNKKSFGLCVQCRTNHTPWNEEAERYDRFCGPACRQAYIVEAKRRMVNKYGKEHLLDDPEMQVKMQNNRSIAGLYKFADGGEVNYLGSYEKDFLETCDTSFGFKSTDIIRSTDGFEYEYEGKKHLYIPDYFLPNFNLFVEIKDGGDNPNMHPKIQAVDKVKEKLKDEAMLKQKKYNFIKIVNKDYKPFAYIIKAIQDMAWEDPSFKSLINGICVIP